MPQAQYIAKRHLNRVGDGDAARAVRPGEPVPEAAGWPRVWFDMGHVELVDMGAEEAGAPELQSEPVAPVTQKRKRGRPRKNGG